jgi:Ca2+/Na+ antiporter
MYYLVKDVAQLKKYEFLHSLVDNLSEVRPRRVKRKFYETEGFSSRTLEVDKLLKINSVCSSTEKHQLKSIEIERYNGKIFKTIMGIKIDKEKSIIDEYVKGLTHSTGEFLRKYEPNDDTFEVLYTRVNKLEFLEMYNNGQRKYLIVAQQGIVKIFLDFDDKRDDLCYQCLPLSEEEDGSLSWKFIGVMATVAFMIAGMYLYFKSFTAIALIVGMSFSILSMSEGVNPQQKSVFRILQIIIYAIAIIFIR